MFCKLITLCMVVCVIYGETVSMLCLYPSIFIAFTSTEEANAVEVPGTSIEKVKTATMMGKNFSPCALA